LFGRIPKLILWSVLLISSGVGLDHQAAHDKEFLKRGEEKMKKTLFPLIAMALVLGLAVVLVGPVSAGFQGVGEGSLEILKLDENGKNLYGATFVISPDPMDWLGDLTVVDNGTNDNDYLIYGDKKPGVLLVLFCIVDPNKEYTVTETVAPPGFQAAAAQTVKITSAEEKVTLTFINETTTVGGEIHPINRVGVLAPWLGLGLLLIGGVTWFTLRRCTT